MYSLQYTNEKGQTVFFITPRYESFLAKCEEMNIEIPEAATDHG